MSMPGNPHYEDTEFCLNGVHDWQEREGDTDATNIASALEASARATLALAHEQRTTNLIGLLNLSGKDLTGWPREAAEQWMKTLQNIDMRLGQP